MLSMLIGMIVLISVLVFVHELGHYLVAKHYGIGVEIFSIGFGPILFSFKKGDTVYQLAAIPLGGFVKLAGSTSEEEVPEEFRGKEMYKTAPWKRLLVLAAGPVFNIIFAICIFAAMAFKGTQVSEPIIGHTILGGVAEQSGLKPGDKILKANGKQVQSWEEFRQHIFMSPGKKVQLTFSRNGQVKELQVVPDLFTLEGYDGKEVKVGRIGIYGGFLNSYITILDQGSLAFKAGLRTGDRIVAVEYLRSGSLKTVETKFWHQLRDTEEHIFADKPGKISFVLIRGNSKPQKIEVSSLSYLTSPMKKGRVLKGLGISLNTLIVSASKNSSALKENDVILALNGKRIKDIQDFKIEMYDNKKPKALIQVNRQGIVREVEVSLMPEIRQSMHGKETIYELTNGFPMEELSPLPSKLKASRNPLVALADGTRATYVMTVAMVRGIWDLITGTIPAGAVGGPMMIAKVAGDSIQVGLQKFFEVMALISINLAIVNFIPIPILDGGRMVIVTIEWIRRRPLSNAALENFYKLGFVMVMSIFFLATYNDLSRFWGSMVKRMMGFFQ